MIITAPDLLVGNFKWEFEYNEVESRSMFGSQSIGIGIPVWRVSFQTVKSSNLVAASTEAVIAKLRGKANQLALYHIGKPAPLGTLRGTNTVFASAAQGATTITLTCSSPTGSTLLVGDLIGFGVNYDQQVVRVTDNAVVDIDGRITFNFEPGLRVALSPGATATWDKPRALFRQETKSNGLQYLPGGAAEGAAFDLREDWRE